MSQDVLESIIANPSVDKVVDTVRYTAKELASEFGYNVRTIHRLASKLYGVGKQGTVRYYTPDQKAELMLEVIAGCGKTSKQESLPELALEKDTKKAPMTGAVIGTKSGAEVETMLKRHRKDTSQAPSEAPFPVSPASGESSSVLAVSLSFLTSNHNSNSAF